MQCFDVQNVKLHKFLSALVEISARKQEKKPIYMVQILLSNIAKLADTPELLFTRLRYLRACFNLCLDTRLTSLGLTIFSIQVYTITLILYSTHRTKDSVFSRFVDQENYFHLLKLLFVLENRSFQDLIKTKENSCSVIYDEDVFELQIGKIIHYLVVVVLIVQDAIHRKEQPNI